MPPVLNLEGLRVVAPTTTVCADQLHVLEQVQANALGTQALARGAATFLVVVGEAASAKAQRLGPGQRGEMGTDAIEEPRPCCGRAARGTTHRSRIECLNLAQRHAFERFEGASWNALERGEKRTEDKGTLARSRGA